MKQQQEPSASIAARISRAVARNPVKCLVASILVASLLSFIALYLGDFTVELEIGVWESRGTLIASREMQNKLVDLLQNDLFYDSDGNVWEYVENNVVELPLHEHLYEDYRERKLSIFDSPTFKGCPEEDVVNSFSNALFDNNLHAIYKTTNSSKSILDKDVLFEICEAETRTHIALQENGVCGGCGYANAKCLPPYSLLFVLRIGTGNLEATCSELKEIYDEQSFTDTLYQCTRNYLEGSQSYDETFGYCLGSFQPGLVDDSFGKDGNEILRVTSSYFFTHTADENSLYNVSAQYGKTDENIVTTVYDTIYESQNFIFVDNALLSDLLLAAVSLAITFIAISAHTKSIWLTFIGVLQILFSIPCAYFVYYFIAGMRFFPVLNFVGFFVATALGADDVFVAADKWKNARLLHRSASTEDIAAIALPDAAAAMLLTTSTTAVAFFATTICPVAPIYAFALFCGLLIIFNYILNVAFIFPALCLYDRWLSKQPRNCLVHFGCCSKSVFYESVSLPSNELTEERQSLIHKILSLYYQLLHRFRYYIFVVCIAAAGICIYIALTIKLPDDANVRLLPENNPYELHYAWKKKLLSFSVFNSNASGQISWGLKAGDDGSRKDLDSLSSLQLDETFDPSTVSAQKYLLGFCDKLYESNLASPLGSEVLCPINEFDLWLRNQANSTLADYEYVSNCNGADSLPMEEDIFDKCIISWSKLTENRNILEKKGKVKILRIIVETSLSWDAPFRSMEQYWNSFEDFMRIERTSAPSGVNNMFQTSYSFHWYDTTNSMLRTAIGSALIAIGFSAIVVLIASRSITLSIFSVISILFILAATTASLVGMDWNLGFIESICFAILIGISCDFVIHFSHAYIHVGSHNIHRFERSKGALIHMGPSILAAAFTTFSSALVMMFCQIIFFTKFAIILFLTILNALVGSFVVFLVLTESFGPSEPTKLIDSLWKRITLLFSSSESSGESYR